MSAIRDAIVAEALSWERTPYHHQARVKGVGVDCGMLLAEVYEAVGLTDHIEPGNYPHDWHHHQHREIYREWLEQYAEPVETPLPGDVVLYRFGRTGSHAAIVLDWPDVIHSYIRLGVCRARSGDGQLAAHRLDSFWAIKGVG